MSDNTRSIIFTLVLCIVCSLLLTAASTSLKPIQQKNIALNRQQNVLKAGGYIDNNTIISGEETKKLFSEKIHPAQLPGKDGKLEFYLKYNDSGKISGYIIPLISNGLWGKIYGYIALEKNGKTVSGISIYQHEETPGLGGEIEKQPFLKDFVNKKITDKNGNFTGIRIAKGKAENSIPKDQLENYVDGISGATLTGRYLTTGLVDTLEKFEPVSKKFRAGDYNFKKQVDE